MDGTPADLRHSRQPCLLAAVFLAFAMVLGSAQSGDAQEILNDPCEGAELSWGVDLQGTGTQVLSHRRQSRWFHGGKDAEELQLRFQNVGAYIAIYRTLPPAQALEDLKASLWVRCRLKGLRLGLGVTFPHQLDPESKQPLFSPIFGAPSEGGDRFQELTAGITKEEMSRVQTRLRATLANRVDTRAIDFRDAYVDQVVLLIPTGIGPGEVQWDDLTFGPIMKPSVVQPASGDSEKSAARLTWADNRLLANGQPFLPRFVTYQGEPSTLLRELRFNSTWIEDAREQSVLQALADEGLGIFATPPSPPPDAGGEKFSMPPLGPEWNPIDCWMLGRLDARKLDEVARWTEMVQDADRQRRLMLGDVSGHVREFHRCVPLLGASKHIPHTTVSPRDYCEFLQTRRNQALAGRPMATLLPTEAAEAVRTSRRTGDREPVLEPEQIAQCAHLATASGYKIFGFWTHTPLDSDAPGMEERRQILKLLNLEWQILEPWLASGTVVRTDDVRVGETASAGKPKSKGFSMNRVVGGWSTPVAETGPQSPYQVTILRNATDMLMLVDCLEPDAQFQPGAMTEKNLRFLTMRYDDTPTAYEVTTTGVKNIQMDLQPVPGGVEVVLKDFNQHAAIVMSSDPARIEALRRSVRAVEKEAATAIVALASAKLERVEKVHLELQPVAPPVQDATRSLQVARQYVKAADDDLVGGRHDEARRKSQTAMALMRSVQRAYWQAAVAKLSSPVASPHAICFQTLPDHWRMIRRLDRYKSAGENILRSGDFEDQDAVQTLWTLKSGDAGKSQVSLNAKAAQGRFSLALTAVPPGEKPQPVDDPLVTLYSPPMSVYSGQLVRITGKVQTPRGLEGSPDGLMIYDTLKGSAGAHRFRQAAQPGKWQTFEIYRDVLASGEFRLVFELRGWGEAWIDDLSVTVIEPENDVQTAGGTR